MNNLSIPIEYESDYDENIDTYQKYSHQIWWFLEINL